MSPGKVFTEEQEKMIDQFLEENKDLMDRLAELEELEKKQQEKKQKLKEAGMALPKKTIIQQSASNVTVLIDLSFEGLMTDKEISSTVTQIQHCYADNRKKPLALELHASSLDRRMLETFEQRAPHFNNWQA